MNKALNDPKTRLALELARKKAQMGKESTFDKWWFFDTNCLSELAKLSEAGGKDKVQRFLEGKDILVTLTHLQELRKAPDILMVLEETLSSANAYLLNELTRFWYSDLANFLNVGKLSHNSLQVFPVQKGLFQNFAKQKEKLEGSFRTAENNLSQVFLAKVQPDVGVDFDERDLCVHMALLHK